MLLGIEASIRCEKPEFGEGCIPVHLGACFEIGEADMPSVAFQDPWRSGRGLIVVRVRIALSRAPIVQSFASPCLVSALLPVILSAAPRVHTRALLGWALTRKGLQN